MNLCNNLIKSSHDRLIQKITAQDGSGTDICSCNNGISYIHVGQGRFKSHALLTDEALLTAMAYVDLNPIRADMAKTPETSEHTSIKERIKPTFDIEKALSNNPDINKYHVSRFNIKPLSKFEQVIKSTQQHDILFNYEDYLTLVDNTGRIQRADKRGSIPSNILPILQRVKIEPENWLNNVTKFETIYYQRFSKNITRKKSV